MEQKHQFITSFYFLGLQEVEFRYCEAVLGFLRHITEKCELKGEGFAKEMVAVQE